MRRLNSVSSEYAAIRRICVLKFEDAVAAMIPIPFPSGGRVRIATGHTTCGVACRVWRCRFRRVCTVTHMLAI